MDALLEIHLGLSFFVFLLALFIGWVQLGRAVLIVALGLQICIGVGIAAWAIASHAAIPESVWIHICAGLFAIGAYLLGHRIVARDEPRYRVMGWIASLCGLALIVLTAWYGVALYRLHGV
jgi:hypothetical protein